MSAESSSRFATRSTSLPGHSSASSRRTSSASLELSSMCRILMAGLADVRKAEKASYCLVGKADSAPSLGMAPRGRLVEQGPEDAKLADGCDELLKVDRLHDVRVCSLVVALIEVLLLAGGGEHDHGDKAQLRVGA